MAGLRPRDLNVVQPTLVRLAARFRHARNSPSIRLSLVNTSLLFDSNGFDSAAQRSINCF
jgi:hypothetical protein